MLARTRIASLAVFLLGSGQALAQQSLLEYAYSACKPSIERYCSQVTPGEGRMLYCLAAHEDKISAECEYALYTAASVIEGLTSAIVEEVQDAIEFLAVECGTDIDKHCKKVAPGEGRMLMCLDAHRKKLTAQCSTAVSNIFGR